MQGIDTHHADFDKFAPKWKRVRDTFAGQDEVHKAGAEYLPMLKQQEPADYASYVKRAGFYNATWRTVAGLLGMMFRKPAEAELPGTVESYANDIDMAGTTLDTFARKVALEVLGAGRVGIMVDHPDTGGATPVNVASAEALGLRPMLKIYRAECIINWKYARVANHWRLVRVTLQETVEEADGEFKAKLVDQWRVLDLDEGGSYRQRVFQKATKAGEFEQIGADVYPQIGGNNLTALPFYITGPDGVDAELDEPPLIDLVDLNLSHYRTNADYEHGCHFTGLPTAVVSGYTPNSETNERFYIGSTSAWVFPDPNAKASFLEFTGQGLSSLRDNLDRKEQQMAVLGARMIAEEKRVAETATTASIHRTGENSVLSSIALAVSDAMERALRIFAFWAGANGEVAYQINRDYNPAGLEPAMLTALMKAVQVGNLSPQSLHTLMQRADLIESVVTFEDEQERIGAVEPVRPVASPAANDGVELAA